jgi:hypothetical protein
MSLAQTQASPGLAASVCLQNWEQVPMVFIFETTHHALRANHLKKGALVKPMNGSRSAFPECEEAHTLLSSGMKNEVTGLKGR